MNSYFFAVCYSRQKASSDFASADPLTISVSHKSKIILLFSSNSCRDKSMETKSATLKETI